MSFSKKDRKLQSKNGKTFPVPITTEPLAIAIAAALKEEFGNTPSAVKTIARLTRSNERAVRNWFEGKNSPSAENLVILMRNSDLILRTVLTLADRHDLVVAVGLAGLRRQLMDAVAAIDGLPMGDAGQASHDDGSDGT
ncbi:hypothetical protein ACFOKF_08335 [Sphingobium rhizovicinum]|uniref:XRE family transcriptional regulator n=1 Tax=Sphingobium rhizovicinum TaxID=432308 RepID=A0ABV7NDW8_9SPHN